MAKKKPAAAVPFTPKPVLFSAQFPVVSAKKYLESRVLLDDQIILIDVRPLVPI
ncbi:uncharacterized protein PHACADRAFT_256128 [Phanerochaete carnosa HHB-10118-sp]|uniref:Uncharacterized protein n=1 Tax=Phanerochaete carnosa (strain HHB-10118-sp) TaxID=650164 RepID=K5VVC7_PHACS|nr:uncharacterized protein PHACADRAFT_256128 [Phanerochaete carnosa HHB-10118-sp]EKM55478.1 hypothetical protein PHACADRAFT_256128 [Phanerochaete carnosa HHB-10118-sp]